GLNSCESSYPVAELARVQTPQRPLVPRLNSCESSYACESTCVSLLIPRAARVSISANKLARTDPSSLPRMAAAPDTPERDSPCSRTQQTDRVAPDPDVRDFVRCILPHSRRRSSLAPPRGAHDRTAEVETAPPASPARDSIESAGIALRSVDRTRCG